MSTTLLYMSCLTCWCFLVSLATAGIINPPKNTYYWNGRDTEATITCVIDTPVNGRSIAWTHKKRIIAQENEKYTILNGSRNGDFSLTIHNLNKNDSGECVCQIVGVTKQDSLKAAIITVADPPGDPIISATEGFDTLEENKTATFVCESFGGSPPHEFAWFLDGRDLSSDIVKSQETTSPSRSEVTVESLNWKDNGKNISCLVIHPLINKTTHHRLSVKFSPRVSLSLATGINMVLRQGNESELTCRAECNPVCTPVIWYRNGSQILQDDSAAHSGSVVTSFYKTRITEDSVFSCRVINYMGTDEADLAVTVHYVPAVQILEDSDQIPVEEGSSLELNCRVDAVPQASLIQWKKGDVVLAENSTKLTLGSLSRSDMGNYTCIAGNYPLYGNNFRTGAQSIFVNITYAPGVPVLRLTKSDGSSWTVGDPVLLSCSLSPQELGNPVATYQWYKDDTELQVPEQSSVLQLTSDLTNQAANYSCSVSNGVGGKQTSVTIIYDKPSLIRNGTDPIQLNFTLTETSASIACTFRGLPAPHITWTKNGVELSPGLDYQILESSSFNETGSYAQVTSSLSLAAISGEKASVKADDSGDYSCTAANDVGVSEDEQLFTVNVFVKPEFTGKTKYAADIGESITLTCDVWSYPPVSTLEVYRARNPISSTSNWTISDIEMNVDSKVYMQRRTLMIPSVQEEMYGTDYSCMATSSLGSAEFPLSLEPTRQPDPPSELKSTHLLWDTVHLEWTPGFDGGRPQRFMLSVNGKIFSGVTSNHSMLIQGLYGGQVYKIKVKAVNDRGSSDYSSVLAITTPNFVIPTPVIQAASDASLATELSIQLPPNSSDSLCILLEGSNDMTSNYKTLFDQLCHLHTNGTVLVELPEPYNTFYRAKVCVIGREDEVCSEYSDVFQRQNYDDIKWIVIGSVLAFVLVVFLIVLVCVIISYRRNKMVKTVKASSTPSPQSDTGGYVNHVMVSEGEVMSPYAEFYPNNDLNRGQPGSETPTGHLSGESSPDNLNYTYASIKKVEKNFNAYSNQSHEMETDSHRRPSSSSDSDNTDEALDELALSDLTGGQPPPPYYRFSSPSDHSTYSTPDSSKAMKKVIYEAIV